MVEVNESELSLKVARVEDLTPEERTAAGELGKGDMDVHPLLVRLQWASPDWRVLLRVGDEVVSGLGIVEREIRAGDQRVRVAGVGDVATLPAWRRRGLAARVLHQAACFMRDELPAEFGLLFCAERLVHYYGGFGWTSVAGPTWVRAPWGTVAFPEETMVLPLRDRVWPEGEIDLEGLPW